MVIMRSQAQRYADVISIRICQHVHFTSIIKVTL